MPSPVLETLAWIWLAACAASVVAILVDIGVRRHRQMMPVMEWVWPITALYLGPVALWTYLRYGRRYSMAYLAEQHGMGSDEMTSRGTGSDGTGSEGTGSGRMATDVPRWVRVGISTSHCGAGCTLGDIAAEWLIFGLGLTLFGAAIYASFVLDYLFAFTLGVVFQYFAITEMGTRDLRELARRTVKADAYSLTAFEVGLFAWMAFTYFVLFTNPHLVPTSPVFWFMMQIGMTIGFLTSYPANAWLIRRGVKEAM